MVAVPHHLDARDTLHTDRHRTRSPDIGDSISIPPDSSLLTHREADLQRAAFRDLHGARLHGFALLVALGDRAQASRAAGGVLAAGAQQAGALSHPERAAAWLRREVMRRIGPVRPLAAHGEDERRAALGAISCRDAAVDGLAALTRVERGAYVAHVVEGFSGIDVEMICQRSSAATRRTLARARDRYLAATMREADASDPADGPLRRRVWNAASRAMAVADGTAGGTGL